MPRKKAMDKLQGGFSIIEVLVAAGLATLLLVIAIPVYRDYQSAASDAALLARIAEVEESLVTYTRTHEPLPICQDYTGVSTLPELANSDVGLTLTFSLVDSADVAAGYRASIVVSADPSQNILAAREVHDVMSQRSRIAPGAVLSDSFVGYEVYITPADDPFCQSMSLTPSIAANSAASTGGPASASGPAALDAVGSPNISFSFSTQQDVFEFSDTGTGSVINNGPLQTGGDMKDFAAEFNVIGGHQVAAQGIHGATFLSYGVPSSENEFYVWKPSDLTVRVGGQEYPTGIDTTLDQETHRYTVLWSSDSGELRVLVDGEVRFTKSGIPGHAIPGNGVLALAQDQDRFQIEDGTQGANHGFSPADAFHGQIFNAAIATSLPDLASLKRSPLASVVSPQALVTDIQMKNGVATDLTGKHQLTVHGDVVTRRVAVDTSVSVPNADATLTLSVTASPSGNDSLIDLTLVGLLPGTVVSDDMGNSGSGASISILGWNLSAISARLPGVAKNMNIGVIATAKGRRGDIATAAAYKPLVLDPGQPVPAS